MIEKMRKVTFLIYHEDRTVFLNDLQKFGLVHIEHKKSEKPVENIQTEEQNLAKLVKASLFLKGLKIKASEKKHQIAAVDDHLESVLLDLNADMTGLAKLKSDLDTIQKAIESQEPWGDFNPSDIQNTENYGLSVKLFTLSKPRFTKLKLEMENSVNPMLTEIAEVNGQVYFAGYYLKNEPFSEIAAREEKMPERRLGDLIHEKEVLKNKIILHEEKIRHYIQYESAINREIIQCRNTLSWLAANSSLQTEADGALHTIQGWVPEKALSEVTAFLDSKEVAYYTDAPSEHDKAPIMLKNNPFARLFEPLLKIFSLPSHVELDTTPFFAPFYTLFFGLCVADVGYGIILLMGVLIVFLFVKNKAFKPLAMLGLFLSLSVIISGLLIDDFFGLHIKEMNGVPPFIKSMILFPERNDAMSLAIMLGVVQLFFGFILRIVNQVKKHGPLGIFMPFGTILLLLGGVFFMVNNLVKGLKIGPIPVYEMIHSIPNAGLVSVAMVITGVLLILLFNSLEHKMKFFLRPLLGLWELYGLLTGLPGDILSYLRLFALGLAGGLLGHAVLNIALLVKGNSPAGIIPMVLILVFGNALNLGIGLLSAFVHSLRLTFVEFYKSIGFTGGGVAYEPFKIKE